VQVKLVLTVHGACAEEEHKAEACRAVRERGLRGSTGKEDEEEKGSGSSAPVLTASGKVM